MSKESTGIVIIAAPTMPSTVTSGTQKKVKDTAVPALADLLLNWYSANGRDLPWRSKKQSADPYRVWLSEIMLQQTTVAAVEPYYNKFLKIWPDVSSLAGADQDDVLKAWAGLGYYSRARNLIRCARTVVNQHAGCFPRSVKELQELPGIGPYTAAAIAAIAFGEPVAVIDGNVGRVVARLFALPRELKKIAGTIRHRVECMVPKERAGDFAQAMMDLGATVCRPRMPKCQICPFKKVCEASILGLQDAFPERSELKIKPHRSGTVYVLTSGAEVYLVRRPEGGLLGGMLAFPSSVWRQGQEISFENAPIKGRWKRLPGKVNHTFTHFYLSLDVLRLELPEGQTRPNGGWEAVDQLETVGLPSVMIKVARLAFN